MADPPAQEPILLVPARGPGGADVATPLFEATLNGEIHVVWEIDNGRLACAPAACPHRPALGPILHTRGVVDAGNLLCTRHANVYSGSTGACLVASGPGEPGELSIRLGTRAGNALVLDDEPIPSSERKASR